jgi:hypothetical protein
MTLDEPQYLLHEEVVASLASGLEPRLASAVGARCLLRCSHRVRAAAHGSVQLTSGIELLLVWLRAPRVSSNSTDAQHLQDCLDSALEDTIHKAVLLLFLQAVIDFEVRLREGLESEALAFAAHFPFSLLDLLEDDGELEPSLVRQLADAEVARQCCDLEEAIDGRVVARDESVVELSQ